ncbi:MAG: AsmA-like C-terminal region-containing protein [Bacteroidales bacterium]
MKKPVKSVIIGIASLLLLVITIIGIMIWLVFTPDRITPIVRKQAEKYISCQSEIGRVELTFFSTFPRFGLKVNRFALINPVANATSDTLVSVEELTGVVDASAWWKNKNLVLTRLMLSNGNIHAFIDSTGHSNFMVFVTDTAAQPESESEAPYTSIDIDNIKLDNINLEYTDLSGMLKAVVRDLTADVSGNIRDNHIEGHIKTDRAVVSFEHKGEKYLQQATAMLDIPVEIIPSRQFIRVKDASVAINGLELALDGTVENDTLNGNILSDLSYRFESWPVQEVISLIPPSYRSSIKDIKAGGILSSEGKISGIMNDSVMPLVNMHLLYEKGTLTYKGFPYPLHDIRVDADFCSDFRTDSLSAVTINQFRASTPGSSLKTKGSVDHFFTDANFALTTDADLMLEELNALIPDEMNANLNGRAFGRIVSDFRLSHLQQTKLEKMKLSGSLTLAGFLATYDSLSLLTSRSKINFELPNRKASSKNTGFASFAIDAINLEARKINGFRAAMQQAVLEVETSDVRDTTRIPHLVLSFDLGSLKGEMDTLSFAVNNPQGKLGISPRSGAPQQPEIQLAFASNALITAFGKNKAAFETINIKGDVVNDNSQQDIFLQWQAKGFVDIDHGKISLTGLPYPLEIPSIQMDFEPEVFTIQESRIKIDKSDFNLSGSLHNILSYFRGDSILRGRFDFVSDSTNVLQLMTLTNGIGNEEAEEDAGAKDEALSDSAYTGPYMVPKGIDILLRADVYKATYGKDTASNIKGEVRVSDGILVLDGLTFSTPAARMQLTAMYKTPRRNHLFLGIDYHMLDVEIEELLTMIPDIDTLMPMLRSFRGKAEFHMALETYLDSLYNVKKSTVRGASSLSGTNLVLLDGERFTDIAKTLKFNKKTENRVDTLSAEFTVFRDEIEVFPFLIVMDKYKAVIGGRHNFDLSFDYNISVVDCPLPIKLAIDVRGTTDEIKYVPLTASKYPEFYRPKRKNVVENKQLELRKLIRESLTKNVIER